MYNYDFSTLNSSDFEEFVCDLLNANEESNQSVIKYRTFKDGKDKGIDFLYSTRENELEIVGQAKHYYRSGFSQLKQKIKNEEKKKVNKLNPSRYIFATSVDLNVANVEDVKELFSPYIKSSTDIYGKSDLNKNLENNPKVLDSHFKLWFSSKNVLNKLLNYSIEGRSSEFIDTEIKKRLRLFVKTRQFGQARTTLLKNKFTIITGEPGIGKTTIAEMLIYDFIKENFELTYIYDDIKEVEQVFKNDDSKQLFYFDDFLGHNSYEIIRAKSSETALMKILRRISNSTNKYLILTTRTFILNSAVNESEKLRSLNLKTKESTIELHAYTESIRTQLLRNHIEEADISTDHKTILCTKYITNFIVKHPNFSPRSIEYITSTGIIEGLTPEEYQSFIQDNFNKPSEIWKHAYEQQISDIDRLLLNTMISFSDSVDISELEYAFIARLNYEVQNNNFRKPLNPFNTTLKRLEGGFIINEYQHQRKTPHFKFINPSLVDFLLDYLRKEKDEVIRIAESAYYLQQLTSRLYQLFETDVKHPFSKSLQERLVNEDSDFIKVGSKTSDYLTIVFLLQKHSNEKSKEEIIIRNLELINDWSFLFDDEYLIYQMAEFLEIIESNNVIRFFALESPMVFTILLLNTNELDEATDLVELMQTKFEIDLEKFFQQENYTSLSEHFSELFNYKIENEIEWLKEYSYDESSADEKEQEIISLLDEFISIGLEIEVDFTPFREFNWVEVGFENYLNEQMLKDN